MKPCKHCGSGLDNNVETCPECGQLADGPPETRLGSHGRHDRRLRWIEDPGTLTCLLASFLFLGPIGYAIWGWPGFAIGAALPLLLFAGGDSG